MSCISKILTRESLVYLDDLLTNWFGVGRCVKKMRGNEEWNMTGKKIFLYITDEAKW